MGKDKKRRAVEFGKDVLIVLLTCSALWLATKSPLLEPFSSFLGEESAQTGTEQTQTVSRVEAARPLRMAAALVREGEKTVRFGALYDEESCDGLFQQVAGLLVETMSSAGTPEQIPRKQWESALTETTGVYFDFQGELPLAVLSGWLTGQSGDTAARVRRLALSEWNEGVALYYQDADSGYYYRCPSDVVRPARLEEALSGLTGNGAFFAFESEEYTALDPDTLLTRDTLTPQDYTAGDPVSGGQTVLETLAREMGFAINTNGVYYAGEWVARSGNDTLRLSDGGVVTYLAGEGGGEHFALSDYGVAGAVFDAVETCRQLAVTTVGSRCGQGRLYLSQVTATENGWEVAFSYSLNGTPVSLEQGDAAHFVVENGRVTQFTLRFRAYAALGTTQTALPVRQAVAAMTALGLAGQELTLVYPDGGGDEVSANWCAWGG